VAFANVRLLPKKPSPSGSVAAPTGG